MAHDLKNEFKVGDLVRVAFSDAGEAPPYIYTKAGSWGYVTDPCARHTGSSRVIVKWMGVSGRALEEDQAGRVARHALTMSNPDAVGPGHPRWGIRSDYLKRVTHEPLITPEELAALIRVQSRMEEVLCTSS